MNCDQMEVLFVDSTHLQLGIARKSYWYVECKLINKIPVILQPGMPFWYMIFDQNIGNQ